MTAVPAKVSELERVLVIAPNWIGDAVMSTPMLANLRRGLPKATIDLLVLPRVAPLFEEYPHVNRVLTWSATATWRDQLAHIRTLRRVKYELALLLPNSFRSAVQAWMIGAHTRVGYATDGRRWFLTHPIPPGYVQPLRRSSAHAHQDVIHQVDAYLGLIEALEIPVLERVPLLVPSPGAEAAADLLWTSQGLRTGEGVVGICPGAASGPAKRWWPERFAALADRLMTETGVRVVLFGNANEMALAAQIRARMTQHAVSFTGLDTLSSFMALAARCRVLVTNDAGSMHVAAAVGTPVVAIFGPTDPRRTAPMTQSATVLRRDLPCSPCFRAVCPYTDHPCMRLIEVEEVYAAVDHMLGFRP